MGNKSAMINMGFNGIIRIGCDSHSATAFKYAIDNMFKKEKIMKVKLKTVSKLMEEGFKFDACGHLYKGIVGMGPKKIHFLGEENDRGDWHPCLIEKVISPKLNLTKDFDAYITPTGSLRFELKKSIRNYLSVIPSNFVCEKIELDFEDEKRD